MRFRVKSLAAQAVLSCIPLLGIDACGGDEPPQDKSTASASGSSSGNDSLSASGSSTGDQPKTSDGSTSHAVDSSTTHHADTTAEGPSTTDGGATTNETTTTTADTAGTTEDTSGTEGTEGTAGDKGSTGEDTGSTGEDTGSTTGGTGDTSGGAEYKTVFLSSKMYKGDLGGLDGADGLCQTLAENAGLPGTYKAWLSTVLVGPNTRFTQSMIPYQRTDGVLVAEDWYDLTDGTIANPINVDEFKKVKTAVLSNCRVRTNTQSDGSPGLNDCFGWTSNTNSALYQPGDFNATTTRWSSGCTNKVGSGCDLEEYLYCFEQ